MTTRATPRELNGTEADVATVLLGMHRELTRIRGEVEAKLSAVTEGYGAAHESQRRSLEALEGRTKQVLEDAQAHADMLRHHAEHAERSAKEAGRALSGIKESLKAAAEPWARNIEVQTSERLSQFEQKINHISDLVSSGLSDIREQTNRRTDVRLAEIKTEFAGLSKLVIADLSDMRESTKTLHGQIRKVAESAGAVAAKKVADMEAMHQDFKERFDAHLANQAAESKQARAAASANDLKRLNLVRLAAAIVVATCAYLVLR